VGIALISTREVAKTDELRLDPHHYVLRRAVEWVVLESGWGNRIAPPMVEWMSNGVNLPRDAYGNDEEDEGAYLYASVAAVSQFAFRREQCQPLKDPSVYRYREKLSGLVAGKSEVLVTRSGTPGIAWPVAACAEDCPEVIPSGFLIRAAVGGDPVNAVYVAGMLNHPAWRVWSASLAAGKRQRNLSQEQLQGIRVPRVSTSSREAIASDYLRTLAEIDEILEEERGIRSLCDDVLKVIGRMQLHPLDLQPLTCDAVTIRQCGANDMLRIDGRFHRSDVRAALRSLSPDGAVRLGELVSDVIRNSQPRILVDDEDQAAESRVVATSSIQAGQVVYEMTKATDVETVEGAGQRGIVSGDVLVTMDGDGSIGKCAVFDAEYLAVPDSHVGILRTSNRDISRAVSCFLNSSLGQAQFMIATTGATGQTQVSRDDLLAFWIPRAVLVSAKDVGDAYSERLRSFEPLTRRVRRRLCEFGAATTGVVLRDGDLPARASRGLDPYQDPLRLMELFELLKPEMF